MIRAVRLSAIPIAALLLLGACSATYDEEVDPTDPASVAAAIIGYAAHEQFDEACEYSSDDQCDRHLREAHARWAEAGLLEQAKNVHADDFVRPDTSEDSDAMFEGRLGWRGEADFADGKPWRPDVTPEGEHHKVATHALQDGY